MKKISWISEKKAAERIGLSPETLRRYAKSGRLDISYTNINGRSFKYDEAAIEKVLNKNAKIIYA